MPTHDIQYIKSLLKKDINKSIWVSIGMPVYNGEKYIEKAINSILSQSYPYFELIISDNASNDKTQEICQRYIETDQRIRYIRQNKNIGSSANFRFVLDEAQYERFIWAAADDWWDFDRLEKLVNALDLEDSIVVGRIRRYVDNIPFAEFIPQPYPKGGWWKYFMREESRCEKVYFIYGLIWRDLARKAFTYGVDGYGGDAIFCYRLLWEGRLKSIEGATLHSLAHQDSEGARQADVFRYSVRRLIYRAHPYEFYKRYINSTPKNIKLYVLLSIPIKAFSSQIHLWFRAFSRILLRKPYIHGRLEDCQEAILKL